MPRQPYHLVEMSPWPMISGVGALLLTSGLVLLFHLHSLTVLLIGVLFLVFVSIQWWRDVIREGSILGFHTLLVASGLRIGMILFIISEVMFFGSFFWAFFHSSLCPTLELGCSWPPHGVATIPTFGVPLKNTAILLASGATVTWTHHSLLNSQFYQAVSSLSLTILLGCYFTFTQLEEYLVTSFSIADSVYGSTFFVTTGFHGLHVIIGTLFLSVCLLRLVICHFSSAHHVGFEAAAWYWHFVDVVWIYLFSFMYWWGS